MTMLVATTFPVIGLTNATTRVSCAWYADALTIVDDAGLELLRVTWPEAPVLTYDERLLVLAQVVRELLLPLMVRGVE